MTMARRPTVTFGVCLSHGVWAASANLARDVLHIAASIVKTRHAGELRVRFVGARAQTPTGVVLHADAPWGDDVDVVILPSRAMPSLDVPTSGLSDWLWRRHRAGASLLSMATGSWQLASTGLLDARVATTHWACIDRSRARFPAVTWTADERLAVHDRVITARDAGASSLALCHLVGRFFGAAVAERASQYALISEPGAERLPLLHTLSLRRHHDAEVLKAQDWLEGHFAQPFSTDDLAKHVHMSSRNLSRRFVVATGLTVVKYLMEVRIARARLLLESTDAPVSQVALLVGYEDAATFSALFKAKSRVTPSEFRRAARFSARSSSAAPSPTSSRAGTPAPLSGRRRSAAATAASPTRGSATGRQSTRAGTPRRGTR